MSHRLEGKIYNYKTSRQKYRRKSLRPWAGYFVDRTQNIHTIKKINRSSSESPFGLLWKGAIDWVAFNNRNLFRTVLGAKSSRSGRPHGQFWWEPSSRLHTADFSSSPQVTEREWPVFYFGSGCLLLNTSFKFYSNQIYQPFSFLFPGLLLQEILLFL